MAKMIWSAPRVTSKKPLSRPTAIPVARPTTIPSGRLWVARVVRKPATAPSSISPSIPKMKTPDSSLHCTPRQASTMGAARNTVVPISVVKKFRSNAKLLPPAQSLQSVHDGDARGHEQDGDPADRDRQRGRDGHQNQ